MPPGTHGNDGNGNHHALEHHERGLIIRQMRTKPPTQLGDSETTPNVNTHHGQTLTEQKGLPAIRRPQGREFRVQGDEARIGDDEVLGIGFAFGGVGEAEGRAVAGGGIAGTEPVDAVGEVEDDHDVEGERGDLGGQTGDHDVDAVLDGGGGVGGGDGAAGGLEEQRDDVEADEDETVAALFDAGDLGAVGADDAGQGDVDGAAEEGGGDG